MTKWVYFCRAISRITRLLYPTKLPRRLFAIEAVTGQQRPSKPSLLLVSLLFFKALAGAEANE
jgi:hypothetical protein